MLPSHNVLSPLPGHDGPSNNAISRTRKQLVSCLSGFMRAGYRERSVAEVASRVEVHVVPDEWKLRLRAYLRATCGEDPDRLSAHNLRGDQSVYLQFDDGSFALFRYDFLTCARGFTMAVLRGQD